MVKITVLGFKGLTHSISYNARTTILTAHNILLPAGVISRIALQSLCYRYSDRNVSLSTLKLPSFRALVLLYCCIDIRTKSNADEYIRYVAKS